MTRHSHAALDGSIVDQDKKFDNGLMYPGDQSGRPEEVYNCRCTVVAVVKGFKKAQAQNAMGEKNGEEWQNESLAEARRVYGKADGQRYKVADGDVVQLKASGREKNADGSWSETKEYDLGEFEVPSNDDQNLLVVTGLPNKTGFLQFDETPNYILRDGRMALNSYAKNNNSFEQIKGAVENEIYTLAGARKDKHFYRVIGSDKEIEYIKNGTIRKSVNHMTGETEDGLSAWEIPKYAGGKIIEITGDVISIGSDGEPLLDITTIKFVKVLENPNEIRNKGIEKFKKKYNWTSNQFEQAMRGGYKLNR